MEQRLSGNLQHVLSQPAFGRLLLGPKRLAAVTGWLTMFLPMLAVNFALNAVVYTPVVCAQPVPLPPGNAPVPIPFSQPVPGGFYPGVPLPPRIPLAPPVTPQPAIVPEQLFQGEVHLEISEKFLQMLLQRRDVSSGSVQDFVSGAAVSGMQTTSSSVSVDCLPSTEGAQFDFVVQGVVNSETTATTQQANIHQQGNTHFRANKRVLLNGENILTQRAIIQVAPNQMVLGAKTRPMPVFGNLADRIAYRAALARLPESNMIAGQKVIDRLQPEIDSKVDGNLAAVNRLLQEHLWTRLKEWNILPTRKAAFSSADRLFWDYRLGTTPLSWVSGSGVSDSGPAVVPPGVAPAAGAERAGDVVLRLHDSLFATVAARRQLGGKTISLNEFRAATDRLLLLLAEEIPEKTPALPLAVNFTFDQQQPLEARYRENRLELYLRGTFQAGSLPQTGPQQIRLLIESTMEADSVTIQVTEVDVREIDPDGSLQEPGITQAAIATQLRSQMLPIKLKREARLPAFLANSLHLDLTRMQAENHWLTVTLHARSAAVAPAPPIGPLAPVPDPTFQPAPTFTPAQPFAP